MTSNIGSELFTELGNTTHHQDKMADLLRRYFRPEFLNRLDETVYFHALDRQHMDDIVTIQLGRLMRMLAPRKISLAVDAPAQKFLADRGFDPEFGARPLKRVIQRLVQDRLAEAILAGELKDGDPVKITLGEGGLHLSVGKASD